LGADILKLYTSYRGDRFQVPTHLTTVTRQTGEYKVDVTRHPKFSLAFGELASGVFPHCFKFTSNFTYAPVSNIITLLPFFIEMIQYDWL
jgi:hypothetical protein